MSAFDKIIGYETIKSELMQICDMFHNKTNYENVGARLMNGILIYGNEGVGKTTLAECFVEESGVNSYIMDKSFDFCKLADGFSDFFEEVKANAPSIVFLDDLDDFTDAIHNVLQVELDSIVDLDVLVIATAKDIDKIPDSLLRLGRFDRKIEMCLPSEADSLEIVKYYLNEKKTENNLNYEDVAKMLRFNSCAEIEAIINDSAINAGFAKRENISIQDVIKAYLRQQYISPDIYAAVADEDLEKIALHEAGHLVVSEVICPGSVGIASVRKNGRDSRKGFISRCKELPRKTDNIMVSLGGKAAVELFYSETCADGANSDIRKAFRNIRQEILESGACGIGMIDVDMWGIGMSENMNARNEAVVHAEMEKFMFKARDILLKNRDFLEITKESLLTNGTLLYSDIKALKESVTITDVAV